MEVCYQGEVYIGIDPQPDNISVCVLTFDSEYKSHVLMWKKKILQRKDSFSKAALWQAYIVDESYSLFWDIDTLRKSGYGINVCVEQQRGRVNSLMEQTLFTIGRMFKFNMSLINASQCKKLVNMGQAGNNYRNKLLVTNEISHILYKHDDKYKNKSHRIHDLCDAYLIAWSLLISNNPKSEIDSIRRSLWQEVRMAKCL